MKNNKKGGIIILFLEIVGVLILLSGAYLYVRTTHPTELEDIIDSIPKKTITANGDCGFTVTSNSINDKISLPLTIGGIIDNTNKKSLGCSWQMFEGQAGTAQLYAKYAGDEDWRKLDSAKPIIVNNWMADSTPFSVTVDFNNGGGGLVAGAQLKIVFTEENASGIRSKNTYELPLVFWR